ncbi:unnamed protein product [Discula destructiva]
MASQPITPFHEESLDDSHDEKHAASQHPEGHIPSDLSEKNEPAETAIKIDSDDEAAILEEDGFVKDPFVPFDDVVPEARILTFRAMLVGAICGALVNASNIYLGLKTGWTFSANIFGTIVGFAVCKFFEKSFKHVPLLGGDFGPQENAILQTSAVAASGLSSVFISAFPAMYQLGLLDTPQKDYPKIVALTAVAGYFGYFFSTPLRKFFIIYVARELRLIFPTPSAVAVTIRSMHSAVGGEAAAKAKVRALGYAFAFATILRVVSQYALGILWDWHIFTWFFIWGGYKNAAIDVENWGWFFEWTPAFIGSGMLVGLNVGISFFSGAVMAWGIIGPLLVRTGHAFGGAAADDPKWADYINYMSLSTTYATKDHPSPRYWLLWPGVLCMLVVSMTELACQYKVFVYTGKALSRATTNFINDHIKKNGKPHKELDKGDITEDFAPPEQQVKPWMWASGLLACLICGCAVTAKLFSMGVGESILAYVLAILFSFLAVQCAGATDITPLTAASKASQIILGGVTKGQGVSTENAQRLNLVGGSLASMGANQASDLVSDFRTGFLLRVPPLTQWIAQGMATLVAIFLAPGMFILFAKAYPCIIDLDAETCPFSAPSVSAWRAVAVAMTDPTFPIPTSSGIFAIVFAIVGGAMVLIRHFVLVGEREWVRGYWPNVMVMAMAFTVTPTVYTTATLVGALISYFWHRRNPKQFDVFAYAIAAGFIAGEGIGGVINAIFQIAGIGGDVYGSMIACPGDSC